MGQAGGVGWALGREQKDKLRELLESVQAEGTVQIMVLEREEGWQV